MEDLDLELDSWAREEWSSGRARRSKWGPFKFSRGYDSVTMPLPDEAALSLALSRWPFAETWSMSVRSADEEARISKAGDSDHLEVTGSHPLAEHLADRAETTEHLSPR